MRLLYLSQSYVPSRRADSVQVMRMCSALANLGHEVELVSKMFERYARGLDYEPPAFRVHPIPGLPGGPDLPGRKRKPE